MNKEKILKAGKIAKQVKIYAKEFIKKDMSLLEIAQKIEDKIIELGAKPAFPTNLSINEVAAHYTPSSDDSALAHGLLKVDFGVHIDGWLSDNAFSLDLENNELNKKLIQSSLNALNNAIEKIEEGVQVREIGKVIATTIEEYGFNPIANLSGHEMKQYNLHAGLTIPNVDNHSSSQITKGLYAIEPFATNGNGKIHDGKPSGIYMLMDTKNIRSSSARKILQHIIDEYQTIPFCERWITKKFGSIAKISLKQLEQNKNLHHFNQLVEVQGKVVAQSENTILIDGEKIVTTQ